MKSIIVTFFLLITLLIPKITVAQSYDQPICVVYDVSHERYLISNVHSGQILSYDANNQLSVFIESGLTSPRGMVIVNDTLYVADGTYLEGFKLEDGSSVLSYEVPTSQKITSITADKNGFIYLIDDLTKTLFFYNHNDTTIKIDPYIFSKNIYTNGIVYSNDTLYIVVFGEPAGVVVFDLNQFRATYYEYQSNSYFFGITTDGAGNYYISSWEDMMSSTGKGKILKFDPNNPTQLQEIASGYNAPSGICYNPYRNEIAIPNYTSDDVSFLKITTGVSADESNALFASVGQSLDGNSLKIKFTAPAQGNLQLFDMLGQPLLEKNLAPGSKEYLMDISSLESGLYFMRINNNNSDYCYKILISH